VRNAKFIRNISRRVFASTGIERDRPFSLSDHYGIEAIISFDL
jgi:hypothetical protein